MDGPTLTFVALAIGLLAAWITGQKQVVVGYLWLVALILLIMALYVAAND